MGEPGQTKAYHENLRWRIVWQRIAKIQRSGEFWTDLNTLLVWLQMQPPVRTMLFMSMMQWMLLICKNLSLLHEVQGKLWQVWMQVLPQYVGARKGVDSWECTVALQISDRLWAEYQAEVSVYKKSTLVFLDESGCKWKDAEEVWILHGYPAKSVRLLANGIITQQLASWLPPHYLIEGTVDGDVFYHFVQSPLLPRLMPFNGTNPNSVLTMDNCSIHHLHDVIRLIHSVSALFFPLIRQI